MGKSSKGEQLPTKFVPKFWSMADGRLGLAREIKRRVELLRADAGVDSYQKELLCQRAVFVSILLETSENVASEAGKLDAGVYGQLTNTLTGLLKTLGIDRVVKDAGLQAYMDGKRGKA